MTDPLAALREKFRARSRDDLMRLKGLVQGDLLAQDLRHLVHGLAGAAGTFGFPALSAAAASIDDDYAAGRTPRRQAFDVLQQQLEAITGPSS